MNVGTKVECNYPTFVNPFLAAHLLFANPPASVDNRATRRTQTLPSLAGLIAVGLDVDPHALSHEARAVDGAQDDGALHDQLWQHEDGRDGVTTTDIVPTNTSARATAGRTRPGTLEG